MALFMGRIHPKKGCDLAIRAFAAVLAQDPDWELVIAGPDQVGLQRELNDLATGLNIANRVHWTGMINGPVKWGAMRSAEVFILPSHQENFGIAVAEALACGVPALISNKVNIWREVQRDGGGLVADDDLEGTCSLLRTWVSMSEHEKQLMRQGARECFEQRFEIHRAADSLLEVLTEVNAN
jgi:glycosyltransferase involved in cell wall biosynthesis